MAYYNPYRGMANSAGAGGGYSYGQQGQNPWFNKGTSNYGQPYNTNPYQAEYQGDYRGRGVQNEPGGWGDHWSRDGGYGQQNPYNAQRPVPGKGRGMGGIGGGMGGFRGGRSPIQQFQQQRSSDIYGGNNPFQIYGDLMKQREMEGQLGMEPGAAWSRPQGMQGWHMYEMFPGLFPEKGGV